MSIKRNWRAARTITCETCGNRAPLWRALLPGSGWKYQARASSEAAHECPACRTFVSYRHLGGRL